MDDERRPQVGDCLRWTGSGQKVTVRVTDIENNCPVFLVLDADPDYEEDQEDQATHVGESFSWCSPGMNPLKAGYVFVNDPPPLKGDCPKCQEGFIRKPDYLCGLCRYGI